MGLAIALLAVMAVFPAAERVRLCAIAGVAIAAASPLVSQLDWSRVPWMLRAYWAPDSSLFGFFPWAAFVAFGMSAGGILRLAGNDQLDRLVQWAALLGFGLILGAQYASNLPYSLYAKSEFWLNSPALILIKLGVILLMLSGAYLWTRYGAGHGWSWIRQFGTTSLLVYWVHTELVYGRWLYFLKERLTAGQAAFAAVCIILLMLATAVARANWKHWRDWRALRFSVSYPFLVPDRVAGD